MEDSLSPESFAYQMHFSENGYSVVTLDQAVDHLIRKKKLSREYIRRYKLDRLVHHMSETWNKIQGTH
jgi:hypothetical protein